jgi:NADP-dependent 3-hydroxy acid dehydrogenase YdfG
MSIGYEHHAENMDSLSGQTALVTGGGSGVGAAVSVALARAGANVHLVGRSRQKLEAVAARVRSLGSKATCHSLDLGTSLGQSRGVHQLLRVLSQLDMLVQSAGVYSAGSIAQASLADFDRQYQTNVRAPYILVQSLLPMLKLRRGQVVFINSSSGITAKANAAQYDSTKHALRAIADSLRAEVNPHGVRVLSVYLGRTASAMQEQICRDEGKPYHPELMLQPHDVASVIVNSLCLPRTAEVTDIHIRPMNKLY